MNVQLPSNGWKARNYQKRLWSNLCYGGKRSIAIWHRRAGKDDIGLHYMAVSLHERVGNGWYCLPEYEQGRKAVFNAINPHTGKRRIFEAFPESLIESVNEGTMFIRLKNQSTFQVIGSDRYDSTVGSSPIAIVYSEWALANPSAWAYHRPILEENNGWALFITTPRGRNHAHDMFNYAKRSPGWFAELLTAEDTGALSKAQLDETLREYEAIYGHAAEPLFRQEFYCDFNAAVIGAFYASEMAQVRAEGRVLEIDAPPDMPVSRSWDLGIGDDTSIWFFCVSASGQVLVLDHLAQSGVGLEWWRDAIEKKHNEHGWKHGLDLVPHDAKVRELGTGRTRVETMQRLGLQPRLVPMHTIDDGVNAVRRTLPMCVFHPRTEDGGLSALEQYRREWDDEKKCFRASAVHDWTSHCADSFRYLSMSWKTLPRREVPAPASEREGWRIPPPEEPRRGGIRL